MKRQNGMSKEDREFIRFLRRAYALAFSLVLILAVGEYIGRFQ